MDVLTRKKKKKPLKPDKLGQLGLGADRVPKSDFFRVIYLLLIDAYCTNTFSFVWHPS